MNINEDDFESDANTPHPVGTKISINPTFVKSSGIQRNNLDPSNSYYKVNKEFNAQVRVGDNMNTNTYCGASQVISPIYEVITVPVGSEIHNLHGGLFLIRDGKSQELRSRNFDLNLLNEIPYNSTTKVQSYRPQTTTTKESA